MIKKEQFWTREKIIEKVDVPEFGEGEFVFVRELKPLEVEKMVSKKGEAVAASYVCSVAVCNEDGSEFFDGPTDSLSLIQGAPWPVLQRLCEKVLELTGLGDKGEESAEKKSPTTPDSDSG